MVSGGFWDRMGNPSRKGYAIRMFDFFIKSLNNFGNIASNGKVDTIMYKYHKVLWEELVLKIQAANGEDYV